MNSIIKLLYKIIKKKILFKKIVIVTVIEITFVLIVNLILMVLANDEIMTTHHSLDDMLVINSIGVAYSFSLKTQIIEYLTEINVI